MTPSDTPSAATATSSRVRTVRRDDEARVTPLELFFDLVFVLALTQVTALMADDVSWTGLGQGVLIMTLLWWVWVGYAWLTSVVDPEEGAVRFAMFFAMAGLMVAALCVPEAFDDRAILFAAAYSAVRVGHLALFFLASQEDRDLRSSVVTLAASSAVGVSLVVGAAFLEPEAQAIIWIVAIVIEIGGPLVFGQGGWKLVPGHFAERHGLILIIALGESIVAIGLAANPETLGAKELVAAVLGIAVAAALWWLYFDVVAIAAERNLTQAPVGHVQNGIARDSYSYLHLPMVIGIVLVAFGLKKTIGAPDETLKTIPFVALLGGTALYLLAHVGFRLRNIGTLNRQRLATVGVFVALLLLADEIGALALLAIVTAVLWGLITYEAVRFADHRDRLRHQPAH